MTILDLKRLADLAETRGWDLILTSEGVRMSTGPRGHHFKWRWADIDGRSAAVFEGGIAWLDRKVAA